MTTTMYDSLVGILSQLGVYQILSGFLPEIVIRIMLVLAIAGVVATVASLILAYLTWLERKVLSDIQQRIGPMRTGPHGLLQPIADGIKLLVKEDVHPKTIDKWVFLLAPIVMFVPVVVVLAVIPFGKTLVMTDLSVGIVFLLAVSSLPTLGIIMASWAQNNKYAVLAGLRRAAEIISYEISMVLAAIGVVLLAGTLSLPGIVEAQTGLPYIILQPLGFVIFFIGLLADLGRIPFDFQESESELVAGYTTEYSGMKFSFFFLAEYLELFVAGGILTTLYLGGWNGPFLPSWLWFAIKTFIVIWVIFWIRATLPRVRIDQLLDIGWKWLLPLALLNIVITGGVLAVM